MSSIEDEAVRREHIKTESTIKTAGILYYLGALGLIVLGISSLIATDDPVVDKIGALVFLLFGIGQGVVGYGLQKMHSWARIPCLILSSLGLFAFPMGTLINALILFNVGSAKGKRVFSEDYKRIIANTPGVRQKRSKASVIILVILLVVLGLILWSAFSS